MNQLESSLKRGRGRPVTGSAKSNAERQKAHRQRAKEKQQGLQRDVALLCVDEQQAHIDQLECLQQSLIDENEQLRKELADQNENYRIRSYREIATEEAFYRKRCEALEAQVSKLHQEIGYLQQQTSDLEQQLNNRNVTENKKRNVTKNKLAPDNTQGGYQ